MNRLESAGKRNRKGIQVISGILNVGDMVEKVNRTNERIKKEYPAEDGQALEREYE